MILLRNPMGSGHYTLNSNNNDAFISEKQSWQDIVSAATQIYGSENVLYDDEDSNKRNFIFKIKDTEFYVLLQLTTKSFEMSVGSGFNGSKNSLINPVQFVRIGPDDLGSTYTSGNSRWSGAGYVQYAVFTKYGFWCWVTTPDSQLNTGFGMSLLRNLDGTINRTQLDMWQTYVGIKYDDLGNSEIGKWTKVQRYDSVKRGTTHTAMGKLPCIGFNQFPVSAELDKTEGTVYGAKNFSMFPPYPEFMMLGVYPGDVYAQGQVVTDEFGVEWEILDTALPVWDSLRRVYPHQIHSNSCGRHALPR